MFQYTNQDLSFQIDKTVEDTVSIEAVTESTLNLSKILMDVKGNIRKSHETVKKKTEATSHNFQSWGQGVEEKHQS